MKFSVGHIIIHKKKIKINKKSHSQFNKITKNNHPLHSDSNYAKDTIFKKKVVNGTFVFSAVVGITVEEFSKKCIANLNYKSIKHLKPVFEGDTLKAKTKILKIIKNSNNTRKISVKTNAYNQKNVKVLELVRTALFNEL